MTDIMSRGLVCGKTDVKEADINIHHKAKVLFDVNTNNHPYVNAGQIPTEENKKRIYTTLLHHDKELRKKASELHDGVGALR